MTRRRVDGPYFDELIPGQRFDDAPGVTLTEGLGAVHQSIVGDRLRLPLDAHLSRTVTGRETLVAHPGLVWDIAIGQSTIVTRQVKANLFYRGLRFHRFPHIGDTLFTRTEVVGLRENSRKPGRPPTGLAALRMVTRDQHGETILDFYRCAMLPLTADPDGSRAVYADDLSTIGPSVPAPAAVPAGWQLDAFRERVPGGHFDPGVVGDIFDSSGDVVSGAPELARMSLNIAATHHDERVGPAGRLVYGGHTIGVALAQATRALPNMVTVLGWHSCDHTGPVHEGDTLTSELTAESVVRLPGGSGALGLRSVVHAHRGEVSPRPVLDWRFTVLMA